MYVSIDRKLKSGCEIQYVAYGGSGIKLRLRVVTTAADQHAHSSPDESRLLQMTAALYRLFGPWAETRIIACADSYFASVEPVSSLMVMGLRFIGVVKTARGSCPMAFLAACEIGQRGDWASMVQNGASRSLKVMAVL